MNAAHKNLIQISLVALLFVGCIAVLLPFTGTLLFAIVICVTTLPIRNRLLRFCRGRSSLAALLVSILLLILLVAPMALLSGSLADAVEVAIRHLKPLMESGLPSEPPEWLKRLPLIGRDAAVYWQELVESRDEMNNLLHQLLDPTRKLALGAAALFAQGLLQLLLVIFFVFFIFRDAHIYADALHTSSRALAGDLGERMLALAEGTVTGVMAGIVGTAATQAVVAMIGFLIAGVPGVVLLTVATFFFSMIPVVGATLIWLGAAVWLYNEGQTGWALFMVLWGMFGISSVDNFIKPILISRTASLPLLLIVVGVFGGVLVFGFIGLFLGPTLLALGQVLIREWLAHAHSVSPDSKAALQHEEAR
ncbi:AI-2E family transporter [Accumulibacter sp.]|uniref:AI-2E family transporter n=1 Tax=Accumulibacter sp. TaxID=2053492 RepID=UPI0025FE58A6|nr:AI-2E family transporter [Accumulibacter sp.]MCM8596292.1 AI-2E family transporter [Accumulibacter sp.]MCM8624560.1 AI-2E family transporter [Accumulibacter sp.]MDS4050441.1 AI-2E family transporter [Accumulibacter sp.]